MSSLAFGCPLSLRFCLLTSKRKCFSICRICGWAHTWSSGRPRAPVLLFHLVWVGLSYSLFLGTQTVCPTRPTTGVLELNYMHVLPCQDFVWVMGVHTLSSCLPDEFGTGWVASLLPVTGVLIASVVEKELSGQGHACALKQAVLHSQSTTSVPSLTQKADAPNSCQVLRANWIGFGLCGAALQKRMSERL